MANDAYKVLQDTSLPKALYVVSDDEIAGKRYETEGRTYDAGSYVLAEDITPPLREAIENGSHDGILEPVSREEAEEALTVNERSTFAPEHSVEAQALAAYGHKLVDRDTVLELRSAGAEDAREAQEAAKADGADERPNLSFEEAPDPGADDGNAKVGSRVKDAEYADVEAATEAEVQVTPSGVMATNPFVDKAAQETKAKPRRSGGKKAAKQDTSTSSPGSQE